LERSVSRLWSNPLWDIFGRISQKFCKTVSAEIIALSFYLETLFSLSALAA
jgi:hypothetical protein